MVYLHSLMAFEMIIIFIRPHYDCDAPSKVRAIPPEKIYENFEATKGQRATLLLNRNWSRKSICSSLLIHSNRSRNGQFQ